MDWIVDIIGGEKLTGSNNAIIPQALMGSSVDYKKLSYLFILIEILFLI
jgi:hypothetical protein